MKRIRFFTLLLVLLLSALSLTACGRSEFGMSDNTTKLMTITARRADPGDFFMVGSLEVADGEKIAITSDLEKGAVKVEIIGTPKDQSIDEVPDFNVEPAVTVDVSGTDAAAYTVPAGAYMLRATCLEKATGSVRIDVKSVE